MSQGFDFFVWTHGGDLPWFVASESCSSGAAIRSGAITHSQTSTLISGEFDTTHGVLSFDYRVSSEDTYDFLIIDVIDGGDRVVENIVTASGEIVYTAVSLDPSMLPSGIYRLRFSYTKDALESSGSDAAFVCNISGLPAAPPGFAAIVPAPTMVATGVATILAHLAAEAPAPSLSANGAYITYGALAAEAPAPTLVATGTITTLGRFVATSPSPTLVATGTVDTSIFVLDSASSQDGLVSSVVGNYNMLDSSRTDDAPIIAAIATYDLLDAHTTEDGTAIVLELTILDTATHETILTRDVHITAEIIDSGRTEDGFTAWCVVEVEVYDAANNVDGVAVVWEVDLLDAVQHADLLSVNVTSTADVLDVAQALSEALGNALVELVLLDQSATQELFDYEAIRNAEILDAALAQALLGTDGDKAFYTYALNTLLNAGSRYGNHNFNSYAATDTACYAAGEGGVFLLEGDDDAGYTIPAGFRTNITDLRTEDAPEGARPRSVQYAYLGMTSSGELRLKASAANGGAVDTRTYRVRQTGDTFDNTTRVVMGKGVQARYWQFTIENVHGEAFDIDQIELLPVARTRRI